MSDLRPFSLVPVPARAAPTSQRMYLRYQASTGTYTVVATKPRLGEEGSWARQPDGSYRLSPVAPERTAAQMTRTGTVTRIHPPKT